MMEVLISVVLITIGILALLTLLPAGWRLSGTSDYLGRAAAILHAEMERNENLIINENNTVTPTPTGFPIRTTVYGSGKASPQPGDIRYEVQTERANLGGSWRVRVRVTWQGNANGISDSLIVTPQKYFTQ